jgi:hypothetical protein
MVTPRSPAGSPPGKSSRGSAPAPSGSRPPRLAAEQIRQAAAFLRWLSGRGLNLASYSQADIDAWHVENSEHIRKVTRPFRRWSMANRLTGRFQMASTTTRPAAVLPDHERIGHLGRVLADRDLPIRPRVAATILLLYA